MTKAEYAMLDRIKRKPTILVGATATWLTNKAYAARAETDQGPLFSITERGARVLADYVPAAIQ